MPTLVLGPAADEPEDRFHVTRGPSLRQPQPRQEQHASAIGRQCIAKCLEQLSEAEAALVRARLALSASPCVQSSEDFAEVAPYAPTRQVSPTSPRGRGFDSCSPSSVSMTSTKLAGVKPSLDYRSFASYSGVAVSSVLSGGSQSDLTVGRKRFADRSWNRQEGDDGLSPCVFDQIVVTSFNRDGTPRPGMRTSRLLAELNGESLSSCSATAHSSQSDGTEPALSSAEQYLYSTAEILWQPVWRGIKLPMLHPEAKFKLLWLIFGFGLIVFESFAIPVYVAFDIMPEGPAYVVESVVNAFFLCDISLQFFSSYLDHSGNLVVSHRQVASSYIRTWLIPDMAAGIPWEWISIQSNGAKMTRTIRGVRALRLLRLMRLMRVVKLGPFLDKLESKLESQPVFIFVMGVIRLSAVLLMVCHWSACIWYAVGTASEDSKLEPNSNGEPSSWVEYYQFTYPYIGSSKFRHYIFGMYFCLTTMTTVGYGDITPRNYDEALFAMVLLLMSSVLFASLTGTFMNMIATLNAQRQALTEKKVLLSRYMRWRAVPWKLMRTVRQHLLFLWDANEGYDAYEEKLKAQLPPILKAELCNHIYGRIINCAPFLAWMKDFPICTKYLAERVESVFLERGDHVFRLGQYNEKIYMLIAGIVAISRNENLFDLNDEQNDEEATQSDSDEELRFDIPRNKAEVFQDLGSARRVQRVGAKMRRLASGVGQKDRWTQYGLKKTGIDTFDSEILAAATVELKRNDVRRRAAARRVQRRWREKIARRVAEGQPRVLFPAQSGQKLLINRLTSRRIPAPAYFGEACLWQDPQEWGVSPPPACMYSMRCESRCELVTIPRTAITEMFECFSPWLPERFQIFREVVLEKLTDMMQEDEGLREMAMDWSHSYRNLAAVAHPQLPLEPLAGGGVVADTKLWGSHLLQSTQPMSQRLRGSL